MLVMDDRQSRRNHAMTTLPRINTFAGRWVLPLVLLMLPHFAHAGLIGSRVAVAAAEAAPSPLTYLQGPDSILVQDPAYELRGYAGLFDLDIGDTYVRIDLVGSGQARSANFLGLLLQDFSGIALLGIRELQSTVSGFDDGRVLFDPDLQLLGLNFQGLSLIEGQSIAVVLDFRVIPLPGTLVLLTLGALAAAVIGRRARMPASAPC